MCRFTATCFGLLARGRYELRGGTSIWFLCIQCGHTFNRAFKPAAMQYGEQYENSLYFSPRFRRYSEQLVVRLTTQFELRTRQLSRLDVAAEIFFAPYVEMAVIEE